VKGLLVLVAAVALAAMLASSAFATVRVTKTPGAVGTGDMASVTVRVTPKARCTIGVYYTTRRSEARGLGAKTGAEITWRWRVGSNTIPGRFPVRIDCGKSGKAQTTIRVRG
jgi:hypothetical protein